SSINQTKQQIVNLDEEILVLQQRQTDGNWLGLEVSQNQFEYSRSLLIEHQSELQQELAEQQLLLKNVQQRIDAMTIQSPIAGTLYDLEIRNVGQTIQANEPIAKVIPADTPLQIKALVSEAEANSIRVGLPTQIHLDSCTYSNFGILEGEVKSVESVTPQTAETFVTVDTANTNQHIVTVEATTDPTETNAQTCKLLPGTKGQINIIAKQERVLTFFLRKLRFSNNV
ncbi:MAG: HlyD family efflux transporter periplasmic adaptor subunit, partial [Cyanobacteria bacterium J06642_11]